jgi:hypothetical protein
MSLFLSAAIACECLQAQDAAPKERWQYCRVATTREGSVRDRKIVGSAQICIITESGCQTENVTAERPAPLRGNGIAASWELSDIARAKALAQLGRDGWELTAVIHGGDGESVTFYFKRRLH